MPTTRSQSVSQARSENTRKKRSRPVKRRSSTKVKTTGAIRVGEHGEEREAKKRNPGREEEEEAEELSVSSTPSSPLLEPCVSDDADSSAPRVIKAYELARNKFREKIARHARMLTLQRSRPCPLFNGDELLPIREPAKRAVLSAAKFVIGLSSFVGGELLNRCSGFWIDWDEQKNTGTLLTTAHILCSKKPFHDLLKRGKYFREAEVIAHLLDGSNADSCLIYYQEHYDLAFFSVRVDPPVHLPSFNDGVKTAQDLFRLGRDESSNLRITHGRAEYLNPRMYERYHHVYFERLDYHIEYEDGGPVIDLDGKVVGIVNSYRRGSFIPSSILLKCLDLWKKFKFIPRPHLGLMFSAIKYLDPVHVDKIWRKYKIDDGLIVEEVSEGSYAEIVGIRSGDIIGCFNGECISTTIELENLLLSLCKGPFDKKSDIAAKVEVSVGVFHIRKPRWRTRELTVIILLIMKKGLVLRSNLTKLAQARPSHLFLSWVRKGCRCTKCPCFLLY